MNLENTIRKVSLGLASLALGANISCSQHSNFSHRPISGIEQVNMENYVKAQKEVLNHAKVIKLHYHKQYSMNDLHRYYLAEKPATKDVTFNAYRKRFDSLNHLNEGTKADYLKLLDLNGDGKVGSKKYFP